MDTIMQLLPGRSTTERKRGAISSGRALAVEAATFLVGSGETPVHPSGM
jgi:hypothetical protein